MPREVHNGVSIGTADALLLVDVVTKDAKAGLCGQRQAVPDAVFAVTTQLETVQVVVDVGVPEQFVWRSIVLNLGTCQWKLPRCPSSHCPRYGCSKRGSREQLQQIQILEVLVVTIDNYGSAADVPTRSATTSTVAQAGKVSQAMGAFISSTVAGIAASVSACVASGAATATGNNWSGLDMRLFRGGRNDADGVTGVERIAVIGLQGRWARLRCVASSLRLGQGVSSQRRQATHQTLDRRQPYRNGLLYTGSSISHTTSG